ncbi:MAG: hypothetical protein PHZ00_04840 [Candidatus Peribacteraceae bacterium]|nr:hypothetical protein [Candidatus Peribacteraceae bacterium]
MFTPLRTALALLLIVLQSFISYLLNLSVGFLGFAPRWTSEMSMYRAAAYVGIALGILGGLHTLYSLFAKTAISYRLLVFSWIYAVIVIVVFVQVTW